LPKLPQTHISDKINEAVLSLAIDFYFQMFVSFAVEIWPLFITINIKLCKKHSLVFWDLFTQ